MPAAIATENSARNAVGSARWASACSTGICRKIDCPRLPRSTWPTHSTNCVIRGWSSPYCTRAAAMSAAVAWSPSSKATGSPEARRVSRKTSTATMASTSAAPPRRLSRKYSMEPPRPSYLASDVFQKKGQTAGS
jgi:hypothetical protein